jgi:UrcA family protein
MKNSIMLAIASAAAMALLSATPAAAENFDRASQRIAYDDLNLNSQRGAYAMLRRIEFAASSVCGDRAGPMTLVEHVVIERCVDEKIQRAVADVNNANVTGLYYGRHPSVTIAGR